MTHKLNVELNHKILLVFHVFLVLSLSCTLRNDYQYSIYHQSVLWWSPLLYTTGLFPCVSVPWRSEVSSSRRLCWREHRPGHDGFSVQLISAAQEWRRQKEAAAEKGWLSETFFLAPTPSLLWVTCFWLTVGFQVLKLHPVLAPVKVAVDTGRGPTVELRQVRET